MLIENIKTLTLIAFMAGWILVISELSMMANGMEVENFYSQRLAYAVPEAQKATRSMQVQHWATEYVYKGNILTPSFSDAPTHPNTLVVGTNNHILQTKRSFSLPALFSFVLASLSDPCIGAEHSRDTFTLCTKQGVVR